MRFEDGSEQVVGACIEVHRHLVLEIKCVDRLLAIHRAQLATYLRLSGLGTGLLVNFRESVLKNGLRRLTLSRDPRHAADSRSA